MEKRELQIDYTVYEKTYPEGYAELCEKALWVIPQAYSVYSGFSVGAALLLENGEVVMGTNQENAAYPSGLCAERTALFYAASRYPGVKVIALAVAAFDRGKQTARFVPPCGACRQVMAETIKRTGDFDVIMIGAEETAVLKASALLPFTFDLL
ncbi:MAG: cytidine deaminase [Oscillibacter sp.]|nr:cytidine deaminase [Oscillibacter sp.]